MPRLRRVAQPRERQSCRIGNGTTGIDHSVLSTNARAAEEPAEIQTLDRPTHATVGQSQTRQDAGNIYRPEKVRYPIYEIKLGVYRFNFLSRPMTEEEMRRKMPLLKLFVFLYYLAFLALVVYCVLLLWSLLKRLLATEASRVVDE